MDTTSQPVVGLGNPFAYLPQTELAALQDEDMQRILREYDPDKEMVVVMFKTRQRTSTYRIQPQPRP